jgi:hypothetical protein
MSSTDFQHYYRSFFDAVRRSAREREVELENERKSGGWNETNLEEKFRLLGEAREWEELAVRAVYYEIAALFEIALKEAALPAYELKLEALWEKYRGENPTEGLLDWASIDQWYRSAPSRPSQSNISFLHLKAVVDLVEGYHRFAVKDLSAFDRMREVRDEVNDWKHGRSAFDPMAYEPPRRLRFEDGEMAIEAADVFLTALRDVTRTRSGDSASG